MGKSILNGDSLILTEVPVYASNIVESKSNGLAGEIIVSKDCLEFFGITGKEVIVKKKKCLELNKNNRYMFDKENLIEYMEQVKNEYISTALFPYKQFKAEPWKNIDFPGWEKRTKKIKSSNFKKTFKIYIKKTEDKDPKKGARYYLAGMDSEEYSTIIKYCIIPQYTNIKIKKELNSKGGYNYVFLLEVTGLDDLKKTLEALHIEEEEEFSEQDKDNLYKTAREKSNSAEENQDGQIVTTKVYKRDASVSAYVKMRADGKCDMCGMEAPFFDKKGKPYLEEHHVIRLADGGEDSIDNAVALCPNCHRKIHVVGTDTMIDALMKRLLAYAEIEVKMHSGDDSDA